MARIGILVHEQDPFTESTYYLRHISDIWRSMGFQVGIYQGLPSSIEADLVFLHVDLTIIPIDYLNFARKLPKTINTTTGDISKSKISDNVLTRSDLFGGRVIVKTDHNCGGYKEANLSATQSLSGRIRRMFDDKLPWRLGARTMYTYPILKATSKVPDAVWGNPNLVVEKFLPEKKDDLYALRTWVFLGDRDFHSISYAKDPVIKSDNIIDHQILGEVPQKLRQKREELGFGFGKFDYAINKDEIILYDVNHTPTLGNLSEKEFMPAIEDLAAGIHSLLNGPQIAPQPQVSQPTPPPPVAPPQEKSVENIVPPEELSPVEPEVTPPPAPPLPEPQPMEVVDSESSGYWAKMAQNWQLVGAPIRPIQEDIKFVTAEVQKWVRPRAVILGVTPELYDLTWPSGTEITAVDHTQEMIDTIWPGHSKEAVCAEWTSLPFEDESKDIVVCDGGLHLLPYPHSQHALVEELRRVLSPEGICIFRLFVPPANQEETVSVIADLVQGKIANVNQLKLKLFMAMQQSPAEGISQQEMWNKLHRETGPWKSLASLIKWPVENLEALDSYQSSSTRYHFVTLEEVKRMFTRNPGGFDHEASHIPVYPMGGRCPTLVFRKPNPHHGE